MNRLNFVLPALCVLLVACSGSQLPPIETAERVDLDLFMGDWYVIASIPTSIEKEAYNAVESYRLEDDGTIATTFTFRKGGFEGKQETYRPRGFVTDKQSNAIWGMRFVWPIKADYRIVHVDTNYTETVIGRSKRDYVWIMTRESSISDRRYEKLVEIVARQGYDTGLLRKVPQQWPEN
ncbi:MAG: lipocalin family protein [Gammaproteobacteria bacterium]